jgi:hypothetical protein
VHTPTLVVAVKATLYSTELDELTTDGVPEMTPVVVLTVNPGGKPVALKPVGPLVAVMV